MRPVPALLGAALLALTAPRQAPDTAAGPGHLFVCGGGSMPAEVIEEFVARTGGPTGRLVVVPTASAAADAADADARFAVRWRELGIGSVRLLHTRDRAEADAEVFCAPLLTATAVWMSGGDQSRLAETYGGTRVERELVALLARGGVVGGTSAGAAIQSRTMIAGGTGEPRLATGFDLLPGCIVDQHFRQRSREARLSRALELAPGRVGIGVDERTALVVSGSAARVLGEGAVTIALPEGGGVPAKSRALRRGSVVDLSRLRRDAADRARRAARRR